MMKHHFRLIIKENIFGLTFFLVFLLIFNIVQVYVIRDLIGLNYYTFYAFASTQMINVMIDDH